MVPSAITDNSDKTPQAALELNNGYTQSRASSSRRDDARGQRGRGRAAVAPDDNSTYNQPELRRDDDAADHLAAVVAAKAAAVLSAVSPQRKQLLADPIC